MRSFRRTPLALGLACAALITAALIYATARAGFRLHGWILALAPDWRASAELPAFVRFNLPDALWQYAFCICMLAVWHSAPRSRSTWLFVAAPVLVGLATELGQAAGIVEGVFDPLDAASMLLAAVAALITVGLPRAPDQRARGLLRGGAPT